MAAATSRRPELSKFIMEERAMFNRSEIMKRSHQLSNVGYSASEALQMAWAEAKHNKIISDRRKRDELARIKSEGLATLFEMIPGSERVQMRLDRVKVA